MIIFDTVQYSRVNIGSHDTNVALKFYNKTRVLMQTINGFDRKSCYLTRNVFVLNILE